MTFRSILSALAAVLATTLALTTAAAAPAHAQVDPYTWYECLNDPAVPSNGIIDVYDYATLDCGGLRHINEDHPVDYYTEPCIETILSNYTYLDTSETDPNNWFYQAPINRYPTYSGVVITAKYDGRVVTAYTISDPYTGSSAAWEDCVLAYTPA